MGVTVSNSECLKFLEDQSTIEHAEITEEETTIPDQPIVEPNLEDSVEMALCAATYYRDCVSVQLGLNKTWAGFEVHSLQIIDIEANTGIKVTTNNSKSYIITEKYIDSNLNDGVSLPGLYLENEGGQCIVNITYIKYQKPLFSGAKGVTFDRDAQELKENEDEVETEYVRNYEIETEENEEVRDLIMENTIPFVE